MVYHASITARVPAPDKLVSLLHVEEQEGEKDRSSYFAKMHGPEVIIDVHAQDSVALRATLVSITKILTVHEKVTEMDSCGS
jgi:tRNA threonylcarbamoyladenosine modification (KEOPS) complex  Pcc1 subunit